MKNRRISPRARESVEELSPHETNVGPAVPSPRGMRATPGRFPARHRHSVDTSPWKRSRSCSWPQSELERALKAPQIAMLGSQPVRPNGGDLPTASIRPRHTRASTAGHADEARLRNEERSAEGRGDASTHDARKPKRAHVDAIAPAPCRAVPCRAVPCRARSIAGRYSSREKPG